MAILRLGSPSGLQAALPVRSWKRSPPRPLKLSWVSHWPVVTPPWPVVASWAGPRRCRCRRGRPAQQQLGRVGVGLQLPGLGAGAEHDVLVGVVLVGKVSGLVQSTALNGSCLYLGSLGRRLVDRAELELGGGADGVDHLVGVGHVGDGHHDVAALEVDLGLGHALGVDPVADDVDGGVELLLGRLAAPRVGGHEGDAGPAAQVEAEPGLQALDGDHRPDHADQREHDQQRDDVATDSWHGRGAPSCCKGFETESLAVSLASEQAVAVHGHAELAVQALGGPAAHHHADRKISKYSRMSDTVVSIWSSRVMVRLVASTRTNEWVAE